MPLIKRTYEKPKNFLNKKNFTCRNLFGEYLDKNPFRDGYDINKEINNLTKEGKSLINTFIKQNKRKNLRLKKEEEKRENNTFRKVRKKEPLWACTLNRIEYFGGPMIDDKYEFIKPKSVKYIINQPPFRRPKEIGDYLNKDIDIFGINKKYND